ncbi:hypothetical protein ACV1EC_15815, partial [Aeromonas hydrophila]
SMMAALKVMTYFKVSLSTHNWDRAFENPLLQRVFYCRYHLGISCQALGQHLATLPRFIPCLPALRPAGANVGPRYY